MSDFEKKVIGQLASIRAFITTTLAAEANAGEEDFWEAFDDEIDVHFSVNDDPDSVYFEQMEFFAYPIIERDGAATTDTSEFVIISLKRDPWQSATLDQTFAPTGVIKSSSLRGGAQKKSDFIGELAHRNGDGEPALIRLTRRPPSFAHDFVLLDI